jgi:hypothetical protein
MEIENIKAHKEICPYCGKELIGFSEKTVIYYMKQHILARHPEKIKFE